MATSNAAAIAAAAAAAIKNLGIGLVKTVSANVSGSGLKSNTTVKVNVGSNSAATVKTSSSGTVNVNIIWPLGSIGAAIAAATANGIQIATNAKSNTSAAKTNTSISIGTTASNTSNVVVTTNTVLISTNTFTTVPQQPAPPPVPASTTSTRVVSSTSTSTNTYLGVTGTETKYGTGSQTPLSAITLYFDYIQTFYIDPTQVAGSQTVSLADIQLYFSRKPHPTNNQSQLEYPGVYVYICQVKNGQPDLSKVYLQSKVRLDWNSILPTLDASIPTTFSFKTPLTLPTGQYYGIVINFEDPQFSLWEATQGSTILGTQTRCGSAYTDGKLFRASNYLEVDRNPNTQDELFKNVSSSDLKFNIGAYQFDTAPVTIELSNRDYEFLEYDSNTYITYGTTPFWENEYAYQDFGNTAANVTFYKEGTIDTSQEVVVNDNYYYKATNTKFLSELDLGTIVVVTDGTIGNTNVRKVTSIIDDTTIQFDNDLTFANTQAKYKVTAVGRFKDHFYNPNTFVLDESNATEKTRFIKDGINYITFTPGQGYANTDYIVFSGAGASLNGYATLTTNSTGNIVSINIVNTGYGFTSTPTVTIYKNTGALGNTSATITATPGSQLKGELSYAKVSITNVSSIPINSFIHDIQIDSKGGFVTNTSIDFSFKDADSNTYKFSDSNYKHLANESIDITNYNAELLSKSLEILNKASLEPSSSEGKSSIIKFTFNTNNKWESPDLISELSNIYVFMNKINNDATDEYKGAGNAVSRHISKKIAFDKDKFAEDIRVISSMWKPQGTDVKIYARIHNSKDTDAFDDKDWTELEVKDSTYGDKIYSSLTNKNDMVEFTYGFRQYPEISSVLTGIARVNSNPANTTVVGVGTSFDTDLANGDMVVLYDPLFTNTTYAVAIVANTPVATGFEINKPLANASLAAATLKVGKVIKKQTAFNNIQNDNVVRYYSTSLNEFDTYDTMAIKIVPLSNSSFVVPAVDDIRVIGVSV